MAPSFEHHWLGNVRPHGDDQLIARIDIPADIRAAAHNGDASAEVLIEGATAAADPLALASNAASRVQAALANLNAVKAYAAEHAPSLLTWYRLPVPASLSEDLFLEGLTVSASHTEIAFDYGELDMIVVWTDLNGRCLSVSLCP
jgi:hypothetical protein